MKGFDLLICVFFKKKFQATAELKQAFKDPAIIPALCAVMTGSTNPQVGSRPSHQHQHYITIHYHHITSAITIHHHHHHHHIHHHYTSHHILTITSYSTSHPPSLYITIPHHHLLVFSFRFGSQLWWCWEWESKSTGRKLFLTTERG